MDTDTQVTYTKSNENYMRGYTSMGFRSFIMKGRSNGKRGSGHGDE
jgi:hypothetical protein